MHVITRALAAPDLAVVAAVCTEIGLTWGVLADRVLTATLPENLLCLMVGNGETSLLTAVANVGAYAIKVTTTWSAVSVLDAIDDGFSFSLAAPLSQEHVKNFLEYLASVASPPGTRRLRLNGHTLSAATRETHLSPLQTTAMRLIGERQGRIVSKAQLEERIGDGEPLRVVAALREHLAAIGSGAQILTVPHMGFRLAGTLEYAPQ